MKNIKVKPLKADFIKKNLDKRIAIGRSYIGYKKLFGGKIACLYIPRKAKKRGTYGYKCRASEAYVIWVKDYDYINGKYFHCEYGHSCYDPKLMYIVGQSVFPNKFDESITCAEGIHFFMKLKDAKHY